MVSPGSEEELQWEQASYHWDCTGGTVFPSLYCAPILPLVFERQNKE